MVEWDGKPWQASRLQVARRVGQAIALCGLSCFAVSRQADRRQKAIVCPTGLDAESTSCGWVSGEETQDSVAGRRKIQGFARELHASSGNDRVSARSQNRPESAPGRQRFIDVRRTFMPRADDDLSVVIGPAGGLTQFGDGRRFTQRQAHSSNRTLAVLSSNGRASGQQPSRLPCLPYRKQ